MEPVTPALYLFARCDRDKEDWYRRLLAACVPEDEPVIENPNDLDEDDSPKLTPFDQYLLCMSKFVETVNNS